MSNQVNSLVINEGLIFKNDLFIVADALLNGICSIYQQKGINYASSQTS